MVKRAYLVAFFGFCLWVGDAGLARAQDSDDFDIVYESARNKIGLLRYCRNKNYLVADTANTAIRVMQRGLPRLSSGSASLAEGEKAERAGEAGQLSGEGGKRDVANLATLFRTTPAGLCQEWASETLRLRPEDRLKQPLREALAVPPLPRPALRPPASGKPATPPPMPVKAPPPPLAGVRPSVAVVTAPPIGYGTARTPTRTDRQQMQGAPISPFQPFGDTPQHCEVPTYRPRVRAEDLTLPSIPAARAPQSKPATFNRREKPWAL